MATPEENWKRFELIDIFDVMDIEISIDSTNKVWINIDGKCAIRIGRADSIRIDDKRIAD